MIFLDVDTAIEVPVNVAPLVDDTDFKSREVAVAYNAAGMDLVWNFITSAGVITQTAVTPTTAGDYDWSHVGDGMYKIEIPASGGASINNDSAGYGWFSGVCDGVLPWRGPTIGFRAAGINNALVDGAYSTTRGLAGTALPDAAADAAGGLVISDAGGLDIDALDTNVASILADTGTDGVVVAAGSKTGYSLVSTGLDLVTAWSVAITGNITGNLSGSVGSVTGAVGSVTGNVGGNVVGSVGSISGVTFPTNFADLAITATSGIVSANMIQISGDATAADNLEAAADGTGYNLGGGSIVAASVTGSVGSVTGGINTGSGVITTFDGLNDGLATTGEMADAVHDEALSGHTTAGTAGKALSDAATNTTTILSRLGAWTGSGINTVLGAFRAIAAKAAGLTPTDLSTDTGFDNTTDSSEALSDNMVRKDVQYRYTNSDNDTKDVTIGDVP